MNGNTETWEEVLGDQVFVFRGERDSSDHSKRAIVEIRSTRTLVKRQAAAGIPPTYNEALLSSWHRSRSNPGTREIVQSNVSNPAHSIYIYGKVGRGKTWAACAIAND